MQKTWFVCGAEVYSSGRRSMNITAWLPQSKNTYTHGKTAFLKQQNERVNKTFTKQLNLIEDIKRKGMWFYF